MRELHAERSSDLAGELQSLGLSADDYSWAVSVLHSRCFCVQPDNLHVAGAPRVALHSHSRIHIPGVRTALIMEPPGPCISWIPPLIFA